jgi:hypothetical protein
LQIRTLIIPACHLIPRILEWTSATDKENLVSRHQGWHSVNASMC